MSPTEPSLVERLNTLVWSTPPADLRPWQVPLVWVSRLLFALYRDATVGYLSLQAMSLVYTTLLSLVPLLAVSFSMLKGFGAHNALEPLLQHVLEPMGDEAPEIVRSILGFVDNMQVGVLGALGLAMLIYVVISMVQKIEQVFNDTWRVAETRPLAQRVSQYLSVLLVGPVLLFTILGLSAAARSMALVESVLAVAPWTGLLDVGGTLVPILLLFLTFVFLYTLVPNARVRLRSALIGALVALVLWESVGWVFARFMAGSTQYTAIYSGLAILILFMIWLYIAWLIVLIGASVAFYHQHPEYLTIRVRKLRLSNRWRERLALLVAAYCARNYLWGEGAWNGEVLATVLGIPRGNMEWLLNCLEQAGFLLRTRDDPPSYVPAKAPEMLRVKDLLDAVRRFGEAESGFQGTVAGRALEAVEWQIDDAVSQALGPMTLRDLATAIQEQASVKPMEPRPE
jgi:membrane protein